MEIDQPEPDSNHAAAPTSDADPGLEPPFEVSHRLATPTSMGLLLLAIAAVLLWTAGVVADARPAPVKKARCFTTTAGDRICLKYECRGVRCIKTHICIRARGTGGTVCTPVTNRVSSDGKGCAAPIPPYYYTLDVGQPLGDRLNDPYHIGVTVDRHLPVPDGFDGRWRITWHGKHGAAICMAKIKLTGGDWEVRCSAGPCDSDLPSMTGDGWFDVRLRKRGPREPLRAQIIIRGA